MKFSDLVKAKNQRIANIEGYSSRIGDIQKLLKREYAALAAVDAEIDAHEDNPYGDTEPETRTWSAMQGGTDGG